MHFLLTKFGKFSNILIFDAYESVVKNETQRNKVIVFWQNTPKPQNESSTNFTSHDSCHKKVILT